MEKEDYFSYLFRGLNISPNSSFPWGNVFGLDEAKQILVEAFIMPLKHPKLFQGNRKPWNSILLFGPPGTGKTLLSEALVKSEARAALIKLSSSSEENDGLYMDLCSNRENQVPTIVLVDDIDLLFGSESTKRTKMELIRYLQEANSGKYYANILVLATSNQPWNIDDVLLKRFEKKIYTPLPGEKKRLEMIKFCLEKTRHCITESDFRRLAASTEGYSGRDISVLVQDALMQPVRKLTNATHFQQVSGPPSLDPNARVDGLFAPCPPSSPGAIEMSYEEMSSSYFRKAEFLEPMINMIDMLDSLKRSKPTTNEHDFWRYKRFQEDFC